MISENTFTKMSSAAPCQWRYSSFLLTLLILISLLMQNGVFAMFQDMTDKLIHANTSQKNYGVAVTNIGEGHGPMEWIIAGYDGPNIVLQMDHGPGIYRNVAQRGTMYEALMDPEGNAIGVCACDIDGDGKEEIYFLNTNDRYSGRKLVEDRLFIWRNDHYENLFADEANKNVLSMYSGRSVACIDRTGNGKYGILLATYGEKGHGKFELIEMDERRSRGKNIVLHSIAESVGINFTTGGRGIVVGPILGHDGFSDIYFVNEGNSWLKNRADNAFYKNDGKGRFTNVAEQLNLDDFLPGRGVTIADFNNDQLIDIAYGNWDGRHKLLLQKTVQSGDNMFMNAATPEFEKSSYIRTVIAADFDNDGVMEVLFNNIVYNRDASNKLFKVSPHGRGVSITSIGIGEALEHDKHGTGAAVADIDNDGILELLISHGESAYQRLTIFHVMERKLNGNNFLRILPTTQNGAPARGSKVTVALSDDTKLTRIIDGGSGYLCQMEPVAHFGLGLLSPKRVEIQWPDGHKHALSLTSRDMNKMHVISFSGTVRNHEPSRRPTYSNKSNSRNQRTGNTEDSSSRVPVVPSMRNQRNRQNARQRRLQTRRNNNNRKQSSRRRRPHSSLSGSRQSSKRQSYDRREPHITGTERASPEVNRRQSTRSRGRQSTFEPLRTRFNINYSNRAESHGTHSRYPKSRTDTYSVSQPSRSRAEDTRSRAEDTRSRRRYVTAKPHNPHQSRSRAEDTHSRRRYVTAKPHNPQPSRSRAEDTRSRRRYVTAKPHNPHPSRTRAEDTRSRRRYVTAKPHDPQLSRTRAEDTRSRRRYGTAKPHNPHPSRSRAEDTHSRRRYVTAKPHNPQPSRSRAEDTRSRRRYVTARPHNPQPSRSRAEDTRSRRRYVTANPHNPQPSRSRAEDTRSRRRYVTAKPHNPQPSRSRAEDTRSKAEDTRSMRRYVTARPHKPQPSRSRAEDTRSRRRYVTARPHKPQPNRSRPEDTRSRRRYVTARPHNPQPSRSRAEDTRSRRRYVTAIPHNPQPSRSRAEDTRSRRRYVTAKPHNPQPSRSRAEDTRSRRRYVTARPHKPQPNRTYEEDNRSRRRHYVTTKPYNLRGKAREESNQGSSRVRTRSRFEPYREMNPRPLNMRDRTSPGVRMSSYKLPKNYRHVNFARAAFHQSPDRHRKLPSTDQNQGRNQGRLSSVDANTNTRLHSGSNKPLTLKPQRKLDRRRERTRQRFQQRRNNRYG